MRLIIITSIVLWALVAIMAAQAGSRSYDPPTDCLRYASGYVCGLHSPGKGHGHAYGWYRHHR